MVIRYDDIPLDPNYPFHIETMTLPPAYNMGGRMHWHSCFEISAVTGGTGAYLIEEKKYPVAPGDIIILNNVEPHMLTVNEETFSQTVLTFSPGLVCKGISDVTDLAYIAPFMERSADFQNLIPAASNYAKPIQQQIVRILQEYTTREYGWQLMIKAELLSLLTLLSRHFGEKSESGEIRRHLMKLQPVFQYIEAHYSEAVTLSECAALVNFTPQYFSSYFHDTTGMKFIDYLISVRIHHTAELLKTSSMTIVEIAYQCGFNNIGNFNTLFKKQIGKTPSEFRRSYTT